MRKKLFTPRRNANEPALQSFLRRAHLDAQPDTQHLLALVVFTLDLRPRAREPRRPRRRPPTRLGPSRGRARG